MAKEKDVTGVCALLTKCAEYTQQVDAPYTRCVCVCVCVCVCACVCVCMCACCHPGADALSLLVRLLSMLYKGAVS